MPTGIVPISARHGCHHHLHMKRVAGSTPREQEAHEDGTRDAPLVATSWSPMRRSICVVVLGLMCYQGVACYHFLHLNVARTLTNPPSSINVVLVQDGVELHSDVATAKDAATPAPSNKAGGSASHTPCPPLLPSTDPQEQMAVANSSNLRGVLPALYAKRASEKTARAIDETKLPVELRAKYGEDTLSQGQVNSQETLSLNWQGRRRTIRDDWANASVFRSRRCIRELWQVGSFTSEARREDAQMRCNADSACIGLMWYKRDGADGRTVDIGWFQGCGSSMGPENGDWDVIMPRCSNLSSCSQISLGKTVRNRDSNNSWQHHFASCKSEQVRSLVQFIDAANRNNIKVFPRNGFLLGVVRHGGFLPNEKIDDDCMHVFTHTCCIVVCGCAHAMHGPVHACMGSCMHAWTSACMHAWTRA